MKGGLNFSSLRLTTQLWKSWFVNLLLCRSQRLSIAKEFGDKAAERRAYSNLGNALIFLGQFNTATEYYRWGKSAVWHLVDWRWSEPILTKEKMLWILKYIYCYSYIAVSYLLLIPICHILPLLASFFLLHFFPNLYLSLYFPSYRKTLQLSRQLRDQVMEAQACYSLGNTYTLLQQYERAIDYHLKHLYIAQELTDRYVLQKENQMNEHWSSF